MPNSLPSLRTRVAEGNITILLQNSAARQDWTSDSRARFFSAEVRKMSTPDRRGMLDRADKALSIRRQCMLLGIARSGSTGRHDQRPCPDAADRRAVHRLAVPGLAANDRDAEG